MIIQTNLTKNYVPDWTVLDAMRELVQNAIDSDIEGFSINYNAIDNTVTILTNTVLNATALYMGESSKRDDPTKLGTHGEGLKLAMLVLLREQRQPFIISDETYIEPQFTTETIGMSLKGNDRDAIYTSIEVLSFFLDEYKVFTEDSTSTNTVIQFAATKQEYKALETICLPKDTPYGILDKYKYSGLYLGGLRITDCGFRHSYNLPPGSIKLERDRRVADVFKVQEVVAELWLASKDWNAIVDGLLKSYYDFEGMGAIEFLPQELIDACVKRADEFDKPPISYSMSGAQFHGRYVPDSFYKVYSQSTTARRAQPRKQPADILQDWFKANRSYFRKAGAKRLAELIEESKKWSV